MEKIGGHTIERHLNKTNPELIKRGMDLIREAEKKGLPKPKTDHISSFSKQIKSNRCSA